jgi:DNA-3-methyladenine glycosylase I
MSIHRCSWANPNNPRYIAYHDQEWGVPCRDELRLFEMLNLEGAQAGLSWETILNKRDNYRAAFDGWDARKIAAYDEAKVEQLLSDPGIVRNRLKVNAAITNARAYLRLLEEGGSLSSLLWDADRESHCGAGRPAGAHRAFRPHFQGSLQARLQVRRVDDHLCVHAGDRDGE